MERAFSVGETVLARIQKGDQMIGDFTLIMPRGKELKKERLFEIYTKQVGSLILQNRAEKRRRKSEKELRENKERYQRYFEELGDAIFILSTDEEEYGEILEVNTSAVDQTGYSREELIGSNLLEKLTSGEDSDFDPEEVKSKVSQGQTVSFMEKKEKKDGT